MAHLYFADEGGMAGFAPGGLIEVCGEEARHAVTVSRLRVGEQILVGDGRGAIATGLVEFADKKRFTVRVDSVSRDTAPQQRLVLVQALAKGDRAERAVEQATEFGVDAIVPWESSRTVSRWASTGGDGAEKVARGVAKWQRIAREASKQALRAWVPEVSQPLTTAQLCELAMGDSQVLVLHPRGEHTLSSWAMARPATDPRDRYLVVGPEGGLSDVEIARLTAAGASILRLGSTVLRTSSAGPAGIAVLNVALRRW
jgi:16S rRNA (uracil1498-N3)-methyltransferase